MIKLCFICNNANVPYYIVDDIVDLLRECKQQNISVQPEHLWKRVHFIKHLKKTIVPFHNQLLLDWKDSLVMTLCIAEASEIH